MFDEEAYRKENNINPNLKATNETDKDGNPTGGGVNIRIGDRNPLRIQWQDGPRGKSDGTLADPNGAFVEDVIYAAKQRLEFFNQSKFHHPMNVEAISCLDRALACLKNRANERKEAGTLGKHEV